MQILNLQKLAENPQPFALIGLARSGKDWVISECGRRPISLAAPIEDLAKNILSPDYTLPITKATPGYRRVLQLWGQWGRGLISEEYPLTPERLAWLDLVRRNHIPWMTRHCLREPKFGQPSFWIDGAVRRTSFGNAISNLRWPSDVAGVPVHWPVLLVIREPDAHADSMTSGGERVDVWADQSELMARTLQSMMLVSPGEEASSRLTYAEITNRLDGVVWNGCQDHPLCEIVRYNLARLRPSAKLFITS